MSEPILTTLAGSHAHGINTEASDFDYVSVTMAPLESTLGIAPEVKTKIEPDAPDGTRAAAGDVEHTTYELRHFLKLATQGNPNILVPLFCAPEHITHITSAGMGLRMLAPAVVSMQAVHRHLGYLDAQYGRMRGIGPHQSRKPSRPELVEAHGYDTKYAAHALRLAWQGIDLACFGKIVLPMRLTEQKTLLAIRAGHWEEAKVCEVIEHNRDILRDHVNGVLTSKLPEHPDYDEINRWLIHIQRGPLK
jgi:hypothetical protein